MKANWRLILLVGFLFAATARGQDWDPSDPEDVAAAAQSPAKIKKAKPKAQSKAKAKSPKRTAEKSKKPAVPAQDSVVGVEGATVYQMPDFDSKVLAILPPGLKVQSSHRTFPGKGGLGLFYRVAYKGDKGYVADTEMIPEFKKKGKRPEKNPIFEDVENMRERALSGQEPIYNTRFFGLTGGMLNYTEKFGGRRLLSQDVLYGLRFSGPGVLSETLPIDLNILFSPKAPSFYQLVSQSAPSGFYVDTELSFLVPLAEENHYMLYVGLGVENIYTKIRVEVEKGVFIDSQEFRIGAIGSVGLALRFGKWAMRGDARYYYEKTSYFGYFGSLEHEL